MKCAGLMNSFVVGIIIVLIAFFMVFFLAIKMGYMANQDADVNICRVTLAAQKLSQMRVTLSDVRLDSSLASACKRRLVDIDDTGIYLVKKNNRESKIPVYFSNANTLTKTSTYTLKESPARTQEALASHFSESMRQCWFKGLEGKIEVFNDESVIFTSRVCMLCDETHVQLTNGTVPKGAWLSSYQSGTNMPNEKNLQTYEQYLYTLLNADGDLYAGGQPRCLYDAGIADNPTLRDGSYATIFFRDFAKIQNGCMAVAVVPAQQVRSICAYIAN